MKNGLTPTILKNMPKSFGEGFWGLEKVDIKPIPNRSITTFEEVIDRVKNPKNIK